MALLSISAIDVYHFSIPFIRTIKVGSVCLRKREGFLLSLTDNLGQTGFGEVAPLPGWDPFSLEDCRKDLSLVRKSLVHASYHPDSFHLTAPCLGMTALPVCFSPHTLFGMESALMSLYLQRRLKDASGPAALPDPLTVKVNGLFIPAPSDMETDAQIQALKASGFKTIKVKIGRLPADEEIRQILRLADAMETDIILRLDGNKNMSADTCQHYVSALKPLNVEYAEEPLQDGEAPPPGNVLWPLALDESLPLYLHPERPTPECLPRGIQTVILKPGLLAGLSGMARFIADAQKRNMNIVLSSSFNTGVTLSVFGAFCRFAGLSPNSVHGLDTLRYLKSDVLMESPSIRRGALSIPLRLFARMRLNLDVLTGEAI